jgi:hypothetical protein
VNLSKIIGEKGESKALTIIGLTIVGVAYNIFASLVNQTWNGSPFPAIPWELFYITAGIFFIYLLGRLASASRLGRNATA